MATIDETVLNLLGSTSYLDQDKRKVYLEFASTSDADAFVRLVANERHQRIVLELAEQRKKSLQRMLVILPKSIPVEEKLDILSSLFPKTENPLNSFDRNLVGGYLPDDPTDTTPDPL